MKAKISFEISETVYPATQGHLPDERRHLFLDVCIAETSERLTKLSRDILYESNFRSFQFVLRAT
jgi:hypothetical protein